MTIKEIMAITGLSKQTIINKIKEKYPIKIEHGKTTKLNQEESIIVVNELKVEVSKNLTVQSKDLTVEKDKTIIVNNELKEMFVIFMKQQTETNKILLSLVQQNNPKIEMKQDYFSILGYMRFRGIDEARFSEMICYGKEASKISREMGKEIRKIPDERFGIVNSYHISVLEILFEI